MKRTFLLKVSYKEWRSGQPLKEVYPLLRDDNCLTHPLEH